MQQGRTAETTLVFHQATEGNMTVFQQGFSQHLEREIIDG
jgi:hypothetical protein